MLGDVGLMHCLPEPSQPLRISAMEKRVRNMTTVAFASTVLMLLATLGEIAPAQAVPSYARQTGQECIACHVSFPELTPYGRYFKLTGYTIGKTSFSSEGMNYVPLAVMAQASVTNTRNNHTTDPDTGDTVSVNCLLYTSDAADE